MRRCQNVFGCTALCDRHRPLSVVLFFLLEDGRQNAFTTYILALVLLVAPFPLSVSAETLAISRSIVNARVALLGYMALRAIWSVKGSIAALI